MGDRTLDRHVGELTLEQEVRLLTGATTWRTAGEEGIGLREMVLSDGPADVHGEASDERRPSALLSSASALGAMRDEDLWEGLGGLLAAEAARKGVDVVLAPTLNLHRIPLEGRHFECFSEDPELTGRAGAALIRGCGRATVITAAPPAPDAESLVAAAAEAARAADAAIVVVGTIEHDETEGHDRGVLTLGGQQDDLVRAVAEANPRTVVAVNSGGPVGMPGRNDVDALLLTWFPGQEAGAGLADVLFGLEEPGGRLPTTWGAFLADAPVTGTRPVGGRLDYAEGLHIGHRAWLRTGRAPAFWFGHGLGYTTWEYEAVDASASITAGDAFTVRVRLRNSGTRAGREVVQVYAARPDSAVERPVRWFAGYAAVRAEAGRTVTAEVEVAACALRHWSQEESAWATEPGPYRLIVGRSVGGLRWEGEVTVEPRAVTG